MDVSTFYALFSATCFTLVGLWWNVVQRHEAWLRLPAVRRDAGGVYLSFLLPALMGLFAQVGGTTDPGIWRATFVVVAAVGCWSTLHLLSRARREGGPGSLVRPRTAAAALYALIAVLGVAPALAEPLDVTPLQAEAMLLVLLVTLAHWLVWEFMTHTEPADNAAEA
ncbi:hypothetical protein RKE38_04115 [Phycicoccus sp. M110.8]|uniref:hypothetical protein n=1 Tax=Phycicoccus sp. M110.8 TaxID=3075433 RepID=UPI0028FD5F15|nr:hypothetical protein [Phycicoccus sp. M110.8]MDU0312861.1 hypothetical protein [Phycicoccus sp. M110.8]